MFRDASTFKSPLFLIAAVFYFLVLVFDGMPRPLFSEEGGILKNVCYFGVYRTAEPIVTNYPTFYSYLLAIPIYFVYFIYYVFLRRYPWEGLSDARLFALVFQGNIDIWLQVGRLLSILFAMGTFAIVYRYCVSRLTRPAAILALTLLMSSPFSFYVSYARYALPDIFVAFIVTSILFITSQYMDRPNDKSLYIAGFLVGLAASAKLNGVLALASLLAIPWIASSNITQKFRLMSLIAVCALLGFFIGSPLNVLKPGLYVPGLNLEFQVLYSPTNNFNLQWLLPALWQEDPVLTLLVIAAVGHTLWRHSKKDMIFYTIFIPSLFFVGMLSKKLPHYLLFLFPWVCIIIGEFFQEILNGAHSRILRLALLAVLVGIVSYEGHRLVDRVLLNSQPDNMALARDWIRKNVSPQTSILLDWSTVPMGFIDLGVISPNEYLTHNSYPSIVKDYVLHKFYGRFYYVPSYTSTVQNLKAQGWKYFIATEDSFKTYLNDPEKLNAEESGSNENYSEYLQRRKFYLRIWQENTGVTKFKDGSGSFIYIFSIM